jgi:hypothetical protein
MFFSEWPFSYWLLAAGCYFNASSCKPQAFNSNKQFNNLTIQHFILAPCSQLPAFSILTAD